MLRFKRKIFTYLSKYIQSDPFNSKNLKDEKIDDNNGYFTQPYIRAVWADNLKHNVIAAISRNDRLF